MINAIEKNIVIKFLTKWLCKIHWARPGLTSFWGSEWWAERWRARRRWPADRWSRTTTPSRPDDSEQTRCPETEWSESNVSQNFMTTVNNVRNLPYSTNRFWQKIFLGMCYDLLTKIESSYLILKLYLSNESYLVDCQRDDWDSQRLERDERRQTSWTDVADRGRIVAEQTWQTGQFAFELDQKRFGKTGCADLKGSERDEQVWKNWKHCHLFSSFMKPHFISCSSC